MSVSEMCYSEYYVGKHKSELDTPALLIDLDVFEQNIQKMSDYFSTVNAELRPHLKTHKSPIIAQQQIDAGAIGITCAKLGEAETVIDTGIRDVLIANQIVGKQKIERLINIAANSDVMVAVDNAQNVQDISDAATTNSVKIRILVEVNIGMNRCGVEPGKAAYDLAQQVVQCPNLNFEGLMGYEGHTVAKPDRAEREKTTLAAMQRLVETKDYLDRKGIEVSIMSGGGTGTFDITGSIPEMTEIQAGSYVFMDSTYHNVEEVGEKFGCALSLMATVVSRPEKNRIVVDTGLKVLAKEFGIPQPINVAGLEMTGLSEEHGKIHVTDDNVTLQPGDRVEILPTHCCTTVNLHDRYYCTRDDIVESVWEISARGKSQ